jgi:hypothetical protein
MVTDGCSCFAEGKDFRVGCGVAARDVAVPCAGYDFSVAYDYCAYGDFSGF